jgi:hypothetical protein
MTPERLDQIERFLAIPASRRDGVSDRTALELIAEIRRLQERERSDQNLVREVAARLRAEAHAASTETLACKACGRPEDECSARPCAEVVLERLEY